MRAVIPASRFVVFDGAATLFETATTHNARHQHAPDSRCLYFEFTRMNIEPIILRKKIEDLREAGASTSIPVGASSGGRLLRRLELRLGQLDRPRRQCVRYAPLELA